MPIACKHLHVWRLIPWKNDTFKGIQAQSEYCLFNLFSITMLYFWWWDALHDNDFKHLQLSKTSLLCLPRELNILKLNDLSGILITNSVPEVQIVFAKFIQDVIIISITSVCYVMYWTGCQECSRENKTIRKLKSTNISRLH